MDSATSKNTDESQTNCAVQKVRLKRAKYHRIALTQSYRKCKLIYRAQEQVGGWSAMVVGTEGRWGAESSPANFQGDGCVHCLECCCIFTCVCVYIYIKTYLIIYFKYVEFIICR